MLNAANNPEIVTLLNKQRAGSPVTIREVALAIANDEETLLKFMVDNDPAQCYKLLHFSDASMVIGQNANFVPDKARVEGEFKLLLLKQDFTTLNNIISKFVLNMSANNYTTSQALISELVNLKALVSAPNGYMFNVSFS